MTRLLDVWHVSDLLMGQAFRSEAACPKVSGYRRFVVFVAVIFKGQAAATVLCT